MSLTIADNYKFAAYSSAIDDLWYAKIYYGAAGSSDFIGISSKDIVIGGVTYYGVVNDWGEISESINLAESSSSISDATIECANTFKGGLLSDELFGTSTRYINRKVEIFSYINDTSLQLYTGRMVSIIFDNMGLTINIEGYRPWADITIPQTKHSTYGIYEPVVYGDYEKDSGYCEGVKYHPIPYMTKNKSLLSFIVGRSLTSDAEVFIYDSAIDKFIPITGSDSASTPGGGGVNITRCPQELTRTIHLRPTELDSATAEWSDTENAYDTDSSTYSPTYSRTSSGGSDLQSDFRATGIPEPNGSITSLNSVTTLEVTVTAIVASGSNPHVMYIYDDIYGTDIQVSSINGVGTDKNTYSWDVLATYESNSKEFPNPWHIYAYWDSGNVAGSSSVTGYARIYEMYLDATIALDFDNDKESSEAYIKGITKMYCGADGLQKSYSGGSGTASLPHEIYRDLLARFTDFDYADTEWDNWSSLNTARSGWACRWWALEPVSLESTLKQLQYEGCFIYKQKNTADGANLIWVKDTYSSADFTFDEKDYDQINVSLTDVNEVVTKTTYNYQRHPAKSSYIETTTYTNSTDRSNWAMGTNENKVEKNLDFIAADKVNTGSNPNDCVARYYDNILSEPKIMVTINLTNQAKIAVETGDVVQFNDSNINPFGKDWADVYFIVTEVKRMPGMVLITAREVYEL